MGVTRGWQEGSKSVSRGCKVQDCQCTESQVKARRDKRCQEPEVHGVNRLRVSRGIRVRGSKACCQLEEPDSVNTT